MRKRMLAAVVAAASCTTILAGTAGPAAADGGHLAPPRRWPRSCSRTATSSTSTRSTTTSSPRPCCCSPNSSPRHPNPDAELTVFLPNDWAFRRLVADLTGLRPWREQAVFDAIAALGTDTVATVLQYHIVAGPPISFEAAKRSDGAVLTTLQGGTITVDVEGAGGRRSASSTSIPTPPIPAWSTPRSVARRPTASPTASIGCCGRSTSEEPAATTSRAGRRGAPGHPRPARDHVVELLDLVEDPRIEVTPACTHAAELGGSWAIRGRRTGSAAKQRSTSKRITARKDSATVPTRVGAEGARSSRGTSPRPSVEVLGDVAQGVRQLERHPRSRTWASRPRRSAA